jgi:hypothetical protein
MFRSVLASRAIEGQQGGSAHGLNRMGSGSVGDQTQLESIEGPGRCSERCSDGQTEMGEDLGDHGDARWRHDLQVPPHWGHCSMPISNIRLSSRPSSWRQAPREGIR